MLKEDLFVSGKIPIGINGNHQKGILIFDASENQAHKEHVSTNPLFALDSTLARLEEKYKDIPHYRQSLRTGRNALRVGEQHFRKLISTQKPTENFYYEALTLGSTLLHSADESLTYELLDSLGVLLPYTLNDAVAESHALVKPNSWRGLFYNGRFKGEQDHFQTNIPGISLSFDFLNVNPGMDQLKDVDNNPITNGFLTMSAFDEECTALIYNAAPLQPLETVLS